MNALSDTGLPQEVIDILASSSGGDTLNLVLRNLNSDGYTAIPDDDLPVIREIAFLVVAFFGSTLTAWAPTAIATLIFLLQDFRKKGISLTAPQGLVLQELRSNPGLTPQQLALGLTLEESVITDTLTSLTQVTNHSNRLTPLVEEHNPNQWYAISV